MVIYPCGIREPNCRWIQCLAQEASAEAVGTCTAECVHGDELVCISIIQMTEEEVAGCVVEGCVARDWEIFVSTGVLDLFDVFFSLLLISIRRNLLQMVSLKRGCSLF